MRRLFPASTIGRDRPEAEVETRAQFDVLAAAFLKLPDYLSQTAKANMSVLIGDVAPTYTNWIRLTGSGDPYTIGFQSRDWKVLVNLADPAAVAWMSAFGFNSGGPVAHGLQIGYEVVGNRNVMIEATDYLIERLQVEQHLLEYDYVVRLTPGLSGEPFRNLSGGRISSFSLGRKYFGLSLRAGQCRLEESKLKQPKIIDLRTQTKFETDGPISFKIGRRHRGLAWITLLPEIATYLRGQRRSTIDIHNHHR